MYQVIIVYDEEQAKSYYYSYVESTDTTLGNISTTELPPYADVNKAHACYWDSVNSKWVFDEEKYASIIAKIKADKKAALEAEAIPTNTELSECVMELADGQSTLEDAVMELADGQSTLEEATVELGEGQATLDEQVAELSTLCTTLLERVSSLEEAVNGTTTEEPDNTTTETEEETDNG